MRCLGILLSNFEVLKHGIHYLQGLYHLSGPLSYLALGGGGVGVLTVVWPGNLKECPTWAILARLDCMVLKVSMLLLFG